jgi:hypothetical protein
MASVAKTQLRQGIAKSDRLWAWRVSLLRLGSHSQYLQLWLDVVTVTHMETHTYLEIVHVGRGAKLHYAPRNSVVTCCGKWNVHQSYSTTATVDCKKCIETVEELKRWQK